MANHAKRPYVAAHAARCPCPRVTAHRRLQHAHRQRPAVHPALARQRIHLRGAPMVVTSERDRPLQLVLVVLGVLTAGANIYPLVTPLLALRPTSGTTAPMFYTILAPLGVFLVLAARNPSAHRSLIAYAVWSSFAHTAVMALMAIQLPNKRGELLAGVAVTGLAAVLLFVLAPRKETALTTS